MRILLLLLLAAGCSRAAGQDEVPKHDRPKNLVLFIGDGMGPQQLGLLEEYARRAPNSVYGGEETTISRLMHEGVVSLSLTSTPETLVVDSAASATQLATGVGGRNGMVGMDSRGDAVVTIMERAAETGLGTGILSDARVTHATPASFAAHVPSRADENGIAEQLVVAKIDILMGGGRRHFLPAGDDSKRTDSKNLVAAAKERGKQVLTTRADLDRAGSAPVLGLFSSSSMMDAMSDRASRADSERQEPTLAEMTEFSLHRLAKNPKGFVLMVEAAQIDWAGHANDAGWMLNEMMKADEVLRTIRRWMAGRDDTLLLVTGDHETGGFGFTYRSGPSARYDFGEPPMLDLLAAQTRSADALATEFTSAERTPERLYELVRSMTPLTFELDDARRIVAAASGPNGKVAGRRVRDEVMRQLADQVNVVWATQGHTSTPIEVIALGPGAAEFRGVLSHIEVGRRLQRLLF